MVNETNQGFITIQSSELFFLENELADIGSRAFAYLLDFIFRSLAIIALLIIFSNKVVFVSGANKFFIPLIIIWWMGYFFFFEIISGGKTPGKRIVGIRVLRTNGSRLTVLDSLVRNIMRSVDSLPLGYFIAIFIMFFDKYNRRAGDIIGNTIVIYDRSANRSIKEFVESMLIDSKPRSSIFINGIERLTQNDKIIIKNLYSRLDTIKDGIEKDSLMFKFHEKITTKVSVQGTDDPEVILCELYKRI